MNFNSNLRSKLSEFIRNQIKSNFTKSDIESISSNGLKIFNEYNEKAERSYLAESEYLETLLNHLKQVNNVIYDSKNWWNKFIGFFGFVSEEEKQLQNVISTIKKSHAVALSQYNRINYPNFIFRILHFFGLDINEFWKRDHYDEYTGIEKLKYLSHHLMGSTDFKHYKILQGKQRSSAYQHFYNDLQDFIQSNAIQLDKHTQELYNALLQQIDDCSKWAQEIDTIHVKNHMAEDKSVRCEFVHDLSYQMLKSISGLPTNSSMIFPHGYANERGGHATIIECKKVNREEVVFKIINTGAGEQQTESYKTLFFTFISGELTRPIKVTSNLNVYDICNSDFIENLLTPVLVRDNNSINKMIEFWVNLDNAGKLYDDKQKLTLQQNGTCSHSSILAWFKTKAPESTFLLFQYTILKKALRRLEEFRANYNPSEFSEDISQVLSELYQAGVKTVQESADLLRNEQGRMSLEKNKLEDQLETFLKKKGKHVKGISNFTPYLERKLKKDKLTSQEMQKINEANPITKWTKPKSKGILSTLFKKDDEKNSEAPLSDRAQKAIIAKKIIGHQSFIENAESSLKLR